MLLDPTCSRSVLARLRWALCLAAGLCACSGDEAPVEGPGTARSNILIVIADDLPSSAFGAFGGELIDTPNLDRLAARGMAFRRTICSTPFCTPSRQSFLTGRWPHAIGVTQINSVLRPNVVTMATTFTDAGYRAAAFGKMHWQGKAAAARGARYGFEQHLDRKSWEAQLSARERTPYDEYRKLWRKDSRAGWSTLNPGREACPLPEDRQLAPWLIERALEFMQTSAGPSLTYLSFYEPHAPFNFPPRLRAAVDPQTLELDDTSPQDLARNAPGLLQAWRTRVKQRGPFDEAQRRGAIAACLQSVLWLDENVGHLLDRLEQTGLDENTLILFWSDNGFFLGERGVIGKNYPFRRAAEVAMSLSGPGIPRGESHALVQTIDAFPTLCELTNVPAPARLDGLSLVPLLEGADKIRTAAYSEFVGLVGMLQTQRWKLMVGAREGAGWDLLFDLEADPGERVDHSAEDGLEQTIDALRSEMHALLRATPPDGYAADEWMQQDTPLEALRWALSQVDQAR
jgi:arylsulfatase A-like enzyme